MKFYLNCIFWIIVMSAFNPFTLNEFIGIPHHGYNFENAINTMLILIWLLFFQFVMCYLLKKINWRTFYEKKYTRRYKMMGVFSILGIVFVNMNKGEAVDGWGYIYIVVCAIIYIAHYSEFYRRLLKKN